MPPARPFRSALLLGALGAPAFALAFPGPGLWPLAFVAIAPLLHAAWTTDRPLRSAMGVFLAWLPALGWLQQFAWTSSAAGFAPLVAYTALYPATFVWILARLRLRFGERPLLWPLVVAPLLWTALEALRGEVIWHGYPWYLLGQPLVECPLIPGAASILGVYGVSWIAALTAGAVYVSFRRSAPATDPSASPWPRRVLAAAAVAVATTLLMMNPRTPGGAPPGPAAIRVAVVQTDVPQSIKNRWTFEKAAANFSRFLDLTGEAARADPRPALIIWPETMFPGTALNAEAVEAERRSGLSFRASDDPLTVFHDVLVSLQREIGVPMLVGAEAVEGLKFTTGSGGEVAIETGPRYNSAFLIEDGAVRPERYDKMRLTPFGEEMPYISAWPWLEQKLLSIAAEGFRFALARGTRPTVFTLPGGPDDAPSPAPPGHAPVRFVTPICFEATLPGLCRGLVFDAGTLDRRADLLVNLTNDGWFYGWDGGRECHLLFARWRCLELDTPMIRAANTGISCAIDARGHVIARRPDGRKKEDAAAPVEGVLQIDLPPAGSTRAPTFFVRFGYLFPWACLAAGTILAVLAFVPRRGRASAGPPGTPGDHASGASTA